MCHIGNILWTKLSNLLHGQILEEKVAFKAKAFTPYATPYPSQEGVFSRRTWNSPLGIACAEVSVGKGWVYVSFEALLKNFRSALDIFKRS